MLSIHGAFITECALSFLPLSLLLLWLFLIFSVPVIFQSPNQLPSFLRTFPSSSRKPRPSCFFSSRASVWAKLSETCFEYMRIMSLSSHQRSSSSVHGIPTVLFSHAFNPVCASAQRFSPDGSQVNLPDSSTFFLEQEINPRFFVTWLLVLGL